MKGSIILLLLTLPLWGSGQEMLTKVDVIQRFLSQNYEVQRSQKEVELAQSGARKAAVGYYPIVTLQSSASADFGGSNQKFQDGREIKADNNLTQTYGAGASVHYNIYQGGQRKVQLHQLLEKVKLTEIQKRAEAERGLVGLLDQYYTVAYTQALIAAQKDQVSFSRQQRDRARLNQEYGRGNSVDVLTAETLFQRDSAELLNLFQQSRTTKRTLIQMLGVAWDGRDFNVESEVEYNLLPSSQQMLDQTLSGNVDVAILAQNSILLDQEKLLIDAKRRPVLGWTADYQYAYQDYGNGGFFARQQSNGVGAGLQFSWNLFDGGISRVQYQQMKIRKELQTLQEDQMEVQIKNAVLNLYDQLEAAKVMIEVEGANRGTAIKNMERIEGAYRLGNTTILVLREAQLNLLKAENAWNNARYLAKKIELNLLQVGGMILGEDIRY